MREIERAEDISTRGCLRMIDEGRDSVIVAVFEQDCGQHHGRATPRAVEFCSSARGGNSPHTHAALLKLMDAMKRDNESIPLKQATRTDHDRDRVIDPVPVETYRVSAYLILNEQGQAVRVSLLDDIPEGAHVAFLFGTASIFSHAHAKQNIITALDHDPRFQWLRDIFPVVQREPSYSRCRTGSWVHLNG